MKKLLSVASAIIMLTSCQNTQDESSDEVKEPTSSYPAASPAQTDSQQTGNINDTLNQRGSNDVSNHSSGDNTQPENRH